MCQEARQVGKHLQRVATDQVLGAVARIPLAITGDGRVDRHDQSRVSGRGRAVDRGAGHVATAAQIQLIPARAARRGLDLFEPRSGQRRQRVDRPGLPGGGGRRRFGAGPDHAAAADRRQDERKRNRLTEHRRRQVDRRQIQPVLGSEDDVIEHAAVLAQRDLVVGGAVDVVEHDAWQACAGGAPEILDVDDRCWNDDPPCPIIVAQSRPTAGPKTRSHGGPPGRGRRP
jgi:hypothetical protein